MSPGEQLLEEFRTRDPARSGLPEPNADVSERLRLEDAIALYESVGHRDRDYLEWLHKIYSSMALPCVSPEYRQILAEDKTKFTLFDIMADDLADNFVTRSRFLLEDFIRIPWHKAVEKNDYVNVGRAIWDDYSSSIQKYPMYKELEGIFYFDLRQALSSFDYSSLINTFGLDNQFEMSRYSPYGCAVILMVDMDLMCMPDFNLKELGTVRSISYLAQKVAHLGNVLGTYPREVLEKDMSSPIISLAVRKGIITKAELGDRAVLGKLKHLEWVFRSKALSYVEKIGAYEKQVKSVNMRGFSLSVGDLVARWGTSPEASIGIEA